MGPYAQDAEATPGTFPAGGRFSVVVATEEEPPGHRITSSVEVRGTRGMSHRGRLRARGTHGGTAHASPGSAGLPLPRWPGPPRTAARRRDGATASPVLMWCRSGPPSDLVIQLGYPAVGCCSAVCWLQAASVHEPPLHIRHQVLEASRPYLLAFHPLVKART